MAVREAGFLCFICFSGVFDKVVFVTFAGRRLDQCDYLTKNASWHQTVAVSDSYSY